MQEFHPDDSDEFSEILSFEKWGDELSVCKPEDFKPLTLLGQDEAIFRKWKFINKCYTLPSG